MHAVYLLVKCANSDRVVLSHIRRRHRALTGNDVKMKFTADTLAAVFWEYLHPIDL